MKVRYEWKNWPPFTLLTALPLEMFSVLKLLLAIAFGNSRTPKDCNAKIWHGAQTLELRHYICVYLTEAERGVRFISPERSDGPCPVRKAVALHPRNRPVTTSDDEP